MPIVKTKDSFWLYSLLVTDLLLVFTIACKKNEAVTLPVLSTINVTNITTTTAVSGGNITSDGGAAIIANGVYWSTTAEPTINDSKTIEAIGLGAYNSYISGLKPNSTYYLRAYAINAAGIAYGERITFRTYAVTDIDGNGYYSVRIGSQVWLSENLKTTRYRNGNSIGTTSPQTLDISYQNMPKYQ
jgi:hypothetical protein